MLRSNTLTLVASTALLLAAAGCSFDDMDPPSGLVPALSSDAEPAVGHQVHRMFEAEKRNAILSELPVQF